MVSRDEYKKGWHKRQDAYKALEAARKELSVMGYVTEQTFKNLQTKVARVAVK